MKHHNRALVWFRADLRVRDNPALHAACGKGHDGVVGLFIIPYAQWREHDWGAAKVDFVTRSAAALSDELQRYNIPLLFRESDCFGDAPDLLLGVAEEYGCRAVYLNREYEVNEQRRDASVVEALNANGLEVFEFDDQAIIAPGRVLKGDGGAYSVFTPFKRRWYETFDDDADINVSLDIKPQPQLIARRDPPPTVAGVFSGSAHADHWPAGEEFAARRLATFINEQVEGYDQDRDTPSKCGTSRLSPYLSAGVISARSCVRVAIAHNHGLVDAGEQGVITWINELVWRDFYRHVMVAFPRVSMNRAFRLQTEQVCWRQDTDAFGAWCDGQTGFPIVDAAMRQLLHTGWMHNRLRMITAMFLTKDLLIDWRWGERYFMQRLVDGDLASNNGGWQWSSSTGTDAAPYFRIFNPWSQGKRFDAAGDLIRQYVPELAGVPTAALHSPIKLAKQIQAKGLVYPQPIVDHAQARSRAISAFQGLK